MSWEGSLVFHKYTNWVPEKNVGDEKQGHKIIVELE